jgi:serine/threonine kinase 32
VHDLDIVHRDIKTDNILIDEEGHCKLSDFNVASIIKGEDRFASTEGNFFFYPPEFCGGIYIMNI